jgi:hypothetical protein
MTALSVVGTVRRETIALLRRLGHQLDLHQSSSRQSRISRSDKGKREAQD